MGSINSYWFDVAVATTLLMVGHLCFGRFVEYQSRLRRLLKSVIGVALLVGTSAWAGRTWMYALVGAIVLGVLVGNGWWLPREGLTAGPLSRATDITGSWALTAPGSTSTAELRRARD